MTANSKLEIKLHVSAGKFIQNDPADRSAEAAVLGAKLVDAERQLDLLFRRGEATDERVN